MGQSDKNSNSAGRAIIAKRMDVILQESNGLTSVSLSVHLFLQATLQSNS
ncbi:unnamed protein product [marine sediment metagenome]|uniref:Uncharacterized protein n=1 Tax=marine sediment metagenome TaxID=412755 RepID=X1SGQ8_9ZZZZ